MRTRFACVLIAACGSAAAPTAPRPAPAPAPQPVPTAVPFANETIVVKVDRWASRGGASPRVLRRIVASRGGNVELAINHTVVSLVVTEVVSGKLYDPDYAKRPVGVNHLEVVLVDEAAYAAPLMEGKEAGTWRLTQLADGTLVASSIDDTPWPRSLVAGRRQMIVQARKDLRSPLPAQRIAGLEALERHAYFELVTDVIALLEDGRTHGTPVPPPGHGGVRVVGDVADLTLRRLVGMLGDVPPPRSSPDVWVVLWRDLATKIEPLPAIVPTTVTEHIRLATYQSWPEFARTPHGVVVGVSRLETPLDGNSDGVFLVGPNKRTWLSTRVAPEAMEVADNGVLYAEMNASWLFKLVDGKPRNGTILGRNARAVYNTVSRKSDGYLVLGIDDSKDLLATFLDNEGKPRIETRLLPLSSHAESSFHRGVQPLAVARLARGWLAVVATETGIVAANITDGLQLAVTTPVSKNRGLVQPKVAAGKDRAIAMWADERTDVLEHVVLDLNGKPITPIARSGSEVTRVSTPVALDDGGFAAAWVERREGLHVGRWDQRGALIADVVVQAQHVAPFRMQLQREDAALVITYLDLSRYPYPLVSRRLELSNLR